MPGWDSKFQKGDPLSLIARPPSPSQQIEGAATMATSFPSKQKLRATVNQPERQLTKPAATLFFFLWLLLSFSLLMRKKTKKKTVSLTSFSRKKITAAAQLRANDFSWLDLSMFEAPYRVFWEEQLLKREKGQTAGRPLLSFTLTD